MAPLPAEFEDGGMRRQAGDPPRPGAILLMAVWFGLLGGYLDLGMIFLKRDVFHASLYYEQGRHFRWIVPVASLAIMLIPGVAAGVLNRVRPGLLTLRRAAWIFATLVLWAPLLRAPLYGAATFLAAAGCGRWLSRWAARHEAGFLRVARYGTPLLACLVAIHAALSCRREAAGESLALSRLPAAPAGAGNLLLIVMDTVRAENMGLYGYHRDTTPNLGRWAEKGVRFAWAMAPAPWTFPSHCSFMTGQWPSALGAHWLPTLDTPHPTLAEFLSSRGYQTAGFAANTHWCSYESRMNRGFAHYEDYPLTVRNVLASTGPGRWLLDNLVYPRGYYHMKWTRSQSRNASQINQALLTWLDQAMQPGRPFFAFVNYLDAHEPFLAPCEDAGRFGHVPETRQEFRLLVEYWDRDKLKLGDRDVELARDAYDDCIGALDRQVGDLLDQLERRGLLKDTTVIITSDHGEEFGEHGVFDHGFSVYRHETHVPLLILSPAAPAKQVVSTPVSLRDIPATAVDLVGQGVGSPFPGRSLAEHWRPPASASAGDSRTSAAISEVDIPLILPPQRGRGPSQRRFVVSLVADGLHYLLDVGGIEELYDLSADPREQSNLVASPPHAPFLARSRAALRRFLAAIRSPNQAAAMYQARLKGLLDSPAFQVHTR